MYRVTTVTDTFTLPTATSNYDVIQVTYKQNDTKIVKEYNDGVVPSGMTLDGNNVYIDLTQEETKKFAVGVVRVQVRALDKAGRCKASAQYAIQVHGVLDEGVLE